MHTGVAELEGDEEEAVGVELVILDDVDVGLGGTAQDISQAMKGLKIVALKSTLTGLV